MTGMAEGRLAADPRLWPVPTAGLLTVEWPQHVGFRAEVFDALGRKLSDHEAHGEAVQLEVGSYGPGVYMARLSVGGSFTIERFVVQR